MKKLSSFKNLETRGLSVKDLEIFRGGAIPAVAAAGAAIVAVAGTQTAKIAGIMFGVGLTSFFGGGLGAYLAGKYAVDKGSEEIKPTVDKIKEIILPSNNN